MFSVTILSYTLINIAASNTVIDDVINYICTVYCILVLDILCVNYFLTSITMP